MSIASPTARRAVIGAIMEHIEEAGIHSGDSACVVPTFSLSPAILEEIASATKAMARELNVRGLMNVQFAVKDEKLYVLEVNPRASRTVPFVSKAIGVPLAKLAAKVMTGMSLGELGFVEEIVPPHYSVKEAVFPFLRFEGINISLGPEMKSTGEVMGIDADLGLAYAKSQLASQWPLPARRQRFHQREGQRQTKRHRGQRANIPSLVSASSRPKARRLLWPREGSRSAQFSRSGQAGRTFSTW